METNNQNATHLADAVNGNVEKNAKFKVKNWFSNGFGETSDESEWNTDITGLKREFDEEIIEYIIKWLGGENFEDGMYLWGDEYEEEYIKLHTFEGTLRIEFCERYRAGGYDDDPVYRFNSNVYVIELLVE